MNDIQEQLTENTKCNGNIRIRVYDSDSSSLLKVIDKKNTVLTGGKAALASCLANSIGGTFNFYITNLLLGTNGVDGSGNPLIVSPDRTGLFGPTAITLPVFASLSNNIVTFTATLNAATGNGLQLSEMALQLASGTLYSLSTFGTVTKSSSQQIIFTWSLTFI